MDISKRTLNTKETFKQLGQYKRSEIIGIFKELGLYRPTNKIKIKDLSINDFISSPFIGICFILILLVYPYYIHRELPYMKDSDIVTVATLYIFLNFIPAICCYINLVRFIKTSKIEEEEFPEFIEKEFPELSLEKDLKIIYKIFNKALECNVDEISKKKFLKMIKLEKELECM